MLCNVLDGLGERILLCRNHSEELLDLGLCAVNVNVADNDYGLVSGVIPGVVEIDEAFGLEGLKMLLKADEGAVGILGSLAEIIGQGALHGPPGSVAPLTTFFDDDAALCIDFGGFVKHIVGIVPQDHEAAVHDALPLDGDVVEHVLGFLKSGGSVDVPAEFRTDGAEVIEDLLSGEILGSVEAHVLKEVGKTVLCRIFFLNCTYVGCKIEFCTLLGKGIVTDVIGKAVVKMSDADLVRIGDFGHLGNSCLKLLTSGALSKSIDRHNGGQCNDT